MLLPSHIFKDLRENFFPSIRHILPTQINGALLAAQSGNIGGISYMSSQIWPLALTCRVDHTSSTKSTKNDFYSLLLVLAILSDRFNRLLWRR